MAEPEQTLLTLAGLERDAAYSAAAAFSELILPAADAVSIFEDGETFRVDAYYGDGDAGRSALAGLKLVHTNIAERATITAVVQENWVARSQAALPPVHAGRFTICGSHDAHRVPQGPNTILVEAGEAFGTAHHATTYGCLLALDRLTRERRFSHVLDLGTGSGILALALQRALPRASIAATDIDRRSIEVASDNAILNRLGHLNGGPTFLIADGLKDRGIQTRSPFDLVVANILAAPLVRLAPAVAELMANGGMLVLSGILIPQAREVCARYGSLGLEMTRHDRHHGWSTITLRMRRHGVRRTNSRARPRHFELYSIDHD